MHHGALAATAAEKDAFAVPVLPQKLWIREPFVPANVWHKSAVLRNTAGHLCLKQGVAGAVVTALSLQIGASSVDDRISCPICHQQA